MRTICEHCHHETWSAAIKAGTRMCPTCAARLEPEEDMKRCRHCGQPAPGGEHYHCQQFAKWIAKGGTLD